MFLMAKSLTFLEIVFLSNFFVPQAESQPVFTKEPPPSSHEVEGNRLFLQWNYTLGGSFFRAEFDLLRTIALDIADRGASEAKAFIYPDYRGKVGANITETQTNVTFLSLTRTDSGNYAFEVIRSSDRKKISNSVLITVQYPPEFSSNRGDVVVVEGTDPSDITLECSADGEPTPNITWTKVYYTGSDSGVLATGNQFVLANSRTNSGTYRCTAYNGIGAAPNRTVKVDVNYKPENVQLTAFVMENEGCKYELNCSADANPSVTSYQLFENDTAILHAKPSGMWKRNASTGGLLMYKCVANNSVGLGVSSFVMVTVNDQNVTENENVTLTCTASGMPQPSVSWTKPNGQSVAGNVLELVNISRNEVGEYKCEASNECGNITEMANIDVHYASRITNISGEQIVNKGEEVSLFCMAESNPAPTITWKKVTDNSPVNFPLTIRGKQDEGLYRCTAKNGVGSPVTNDVNVTVHLPASIVAMENYTAFKGDTIVIYCNVSGTPPPTFLWTHEESGRAWNQKKWTIEGTQVENLGEYRCNASNKYGGDIESTFIFFEGNSCLEECTNGRHCREFGKYLCLCPKGKKGQNCKENDTVAAVS